MSRVTLSSVIRFNFRSNFQSMGKSNLRLQSFRLKPLYANINMHTLYNVL